MRLPTKTYFVLPLLVLSPTPQAARTPREKGNRGPGRRLGSRVSPIRTRQATQGNRWQNHQQSSKAKNTRLPSRCTPTDREYPCKPTITKNKWGHTLPTNVAYATCRRRGNLV